MPATAGRVRMPANNRVHSSAALQTHGIWQSTIGYDPYAPEDSKHQAPASSVSANAAAAAASEAAASSSVNAYKSFQALLHIARISSNSDETRGACKKCGRVGHLTYQCRNFLSMKTIGIEDEALQARNEAEAQAKLAETKNKAFDSHEEGSNDDDIDSDSSDSDIDPVLEKIIAERERGKSRRWKQSEEDDKKTSRHRSSSRGRSKHRRRRSRKSNSEDDSEEERTKDRRKKHEMSDQDSESGSDRKRHRKSRKRQRTHRTKDVDTRGEGRRHWQHDQRRHRRRDAPRGM